VSSRECSFLLVFCFAEGGMDAEKSIIKEGKTEKKKKRKKQNTSFHLFSLCTLVLCPWTTSIPLQLSSGVCRPTRLLHVLRIHPRIQVFLLPYVQSSWPGSNVSSDRVGRSIGQIVYKKKKKSTFTSQSRAVLSRLQRKHIIGMEWHVRTGQVQRCGSKHRVKQSNGNYYCCKRERQREKRV
jgi:hypothetical protein